MLLYRFRIRNLYHLVFLVGMWLLKKMKIFENLSGFQGSVTSSCYMNLNIQTLCVNIPPQATPPSYGTKIHQLRIRLIATSNVAYFP